MDHSGGAGVDRIQDRDLKKKTDPQSNEPPLPNLSRDIVAG